MPVNAKLYTYISTKSHQLFYYNLHISATLRTVRLPWISPLVILLSISDTAWHDVPKWRNAFKRHTDIQSSASSVSCNILHLIQIYINVRNHNFEKKILPTEIIDWPADKDDSTGVSQEDGEDVERAHDDDQPLLLTLCFSSRLIDHPPPGF